MMVVSYVIFKSSMLVVLKTKPTDQINWNISCPSCDGHLVMFSNS